AVPFLIRILETKPSKIGRILDEKLYSVSSLTSNMQVPWRMRQHLPSAMRVEGRREHAAFFISQIVAAAGAAIPTLIRILEDHSEDWRLEQEVFSALL